MFSLYQNQDCLELNKIVDDNYIGFDKCTIITETVECPKQGIKNIYIIGTHIPITFLISLIGENTKSICTISCTLENCTEDLIQNLVNRFHNIPELGIDFCFYPRDKVLIKGEYGTKVDEKTCNRRQELRNFFNTLIISIKFENVRIIHTDHSFDQKNLIEQIVKNCPKLMNFSMCCGGKHTKNLGLDVREKNRIKNVRWLILCEKHYNENSNLASLPLDIVKEIFMYAKEEFEHMPNRDQERFAAYKITNIIEIRIAKSKNFFFW